MSISISAFDIGDHLSSLCPRLYRKSRKKANRLLYWRRHFDGRRNGENIPFPQAVIHKEVWFFTGKPYLTGNGGAGSSTRHSGGYPGMWITQQQAFPWIIRGRKIFSLLHKSQKSFRPAGRIALGWSMESPSKSQRYSCRVRFLTSEGSLGHWNRPLFWLTNFLPPRTSKSTYFFI